MTQTAKRERQAKTPSIRDIARVAGVAASTVSRVLNGRQTDIRVTDATQRRIWQACAELRYHPNIHAKRLFGRCSHTLALVVPPVGHVTPEVPNFADPNLALTLSGVMEAATAAGQDVLLLTGDRAFAESRKCLTLFRGGAIDGMIAWGTVREDSCCIRELHDEGWPVVVVNGFVDGDDIPHIGCDNGAGAAEVARIVIHNGHRHVAWINGPATSSVSEERRTGALEALQGAGITVKTYPGNFSVRSGREAADSFLAEPDRPTAVLCANDSMALGVIEAALARGLSVPEDLSVTGADDAFSYFRPRLTTFAAPARELGERGVALLMSVAAGPEAWNEWRKAGRHSLNVTVCEGETTAAARTQGG